jgi:hypothetical protein
MIPRDVWSSSDMTARNYYADAQYEVTAPGGKTYTPSRGNYWRWVYAEAQPKGRIIVMFEDEVITWVNTMKAATSSDSAIHVPVIQPIGIQALQSMPVTSVE